MQIAVTNIHGWQLKSVVTHYESAVNISCLICMGSRIQKSSVSKQITVKRRKHNRNNELCIKNQNIYVYLKVEEHSEKSGFEFCFFSFHLYTSQLYPWCGLSCQYKYLALLWHFSPHEIFSMYLFSYLVCLFNCLFNA